MKLTASNAGFVGHGGPSISGPDGKPVLLREGVGVVFDCPCGCADLIHVAFENPLDGGPPAASPGQPLWKRKGETLETLTLRPSIRRIGGCSCHGFITDGEAVNV